MNRYTLKVPKPQLEAVVKAIHASDYFTKPTAVWNERSPSVILRVEPAERFHEQLTELLRGESYRIHIDVDAETATVRTPTGRTYRMDRRAPKGERCDCVSERQKRFQKGRSDCKHRLAAFGPFNRLGLLKS